MTQVDFYILEPAAQGDRYHLVCRIAEKARRAGHRVLIHTSLDAEAEHVDGLLWTLWESSFVPHGRVGRDAPKLNPIMIGDGGSDAQEHGILINLDAEVPVFFGRFDRLIECIDHDDTVKACGREHFRFYREHGYPLNTHNIS